jgi:hypothetical protein
MIRTRGILLAGTFGLLIFGGDGGSGARPRISAVAQSMLSLNPTADPQDSAASIPPPSDEPFWPQWGANPQHTGMVDVEGQQVRQQLADIVYDKFVPQEAAENIPLFGEAALTVHYQAPIIDGNDVYMMTKTGTYTSCNPPGDWLNGTQCGPNTWNTMIWNETRSTWEHEHPRDKDDKSSHRRVPRLVQVWSFQSDWKPDQIARTGRELAILNLYSTRSMRTALFMFRELPEPSGRSKKRMGPRLRTSTRSTQ